MFDEVKGKVGSVKIKKMDILKDGLKLLSLSGIITFNSEGKKAGQAYKYYNRDGSFKEKVVWIFDLKGNEIECAVYDKDNSQVERRTENIKGNKTESAFYDKEDKVVHKTAVVKDFKNKLLDVTHLSSDGSILEKEVIKIGKVLLAKMQTLIRIVLLNTMNLTM